RPAGRRRRILLLHRYSWKRHCEPPGGEAIIDLHEGTKKKGSHEIRPTSSCLSSPSWLRVRICRGVALAVESQLWQRHALLAHIFAGAVGVAHLARLVALQEQELARALVRIDL